MSRYPEAWVLGAAAGCVMRVIVDKRGNSPAARLPATVLAACGL